MNAMSNDRHLAMSLLQTICNPHSLQLVVVPGEPTSKLTSPHRFSRGKPYIPRKTIENREAIASWLSRMESLQGNVAVVCVFRRASLQRIDVDNLLKAVLDGGTKVSLWKDDSQVTALMGIVEYDRQNPRTVVCMAEHQSSLPRGKNALVSCEACGKQFLPGGQRREKARWCSKECQTYLREEVPCPSCGKKFRRQSSYHKYCSNVCRGIAYSENAKKRTKCRRGHRMTKANTHYFKDGTRRCRKCQAMTAKAYRDRKGRWSNEKNQPA